MQPSSSPRSPMTFVLVHGAWHGGWCWQRVAERLRAQGHRVHAPSLTGLADRSHLLSPDIGLQTHVDDIVNLVKWEGLDDIVLCGHSYGGMVITGAAEALQGRVRSLVYLDAFVPEAGRSMVEHLTSEASRQRFQDLADKAGGGYIAPIPARAFLVNEQDQAWVDRQCTLHPYKSFHDPLPSVAGRDAVRTKVYVLAAAYNSPMFVDAANRLRQQPDWTVVDLPYGHDLMVDAPDEVAEVLLRAAN